MRIRVFLDPGEFVAFYLAAGGGRIQSFDSLEAVVANLDRAVLLCLEDSRPPVPRVLLVAFPLDFKATLADLCQRAKLAPWLPPKLPPKTATTLLRAQLVGFEQSELEARLADELAQWGVEMVPGPRGIAARFSYSKRGTWQLTIMDDAESLSDSNVDSGGSSDSVLSDGEEASPQDVDTTDRDLLPIVFAFDAHGASKSLKRTSREQAQFVAPGPNTSKRKVSGWPGPVVRLVREKFAILVLKPSSEKPGSVGLGVLPADQRVDDAYLLTIHDQLSDITLFTYLPRHQKLAQIARRIATARAGDFVRWLDLRLRAEELHIGWRRQGPVLTVSLDAPRDVVVHVDEVGGDQGEQERILEAVNEVLNANLGPRKIDSGPKRLTHGLIHVKVHADKQRTLGAFTIDESTMFRLQTPETLGRDLRVLTTLSACDFMTCPAQQLTRVELSSLPYFLPAMPRFVCVWSYDCKTHRLSIFHADEATLDEGGRLLTVLNFILHNQAEGTVHIEFLVDTMEGVAKDLKKAFLKQIRGLDVVVARWAPAPATVRRFSVPADRSAEHQCSVEEVSESAYSRIEGEYERMALFGPFESPADSESAGATGSSSGTGTGSDSDSDSSSGSSSGSGSSSDGSRGSVHATGTG